MAPSGAHAAQRCACRHAPIALLPPRRQFPELRGRVKCRDVALHFWDASDDLLGCGMELVFEGDRVYLHGARGWFGAVPLAVTGDLDLNPETGSYRWVGAAAARLTT